MSADAGGDSIVCTVSFSPDSSKIASGSNDDTVKLWDVTSGSVCNAGGAFLWCAQCVVFSDGTKVMSGSMTKVKLWDVTSGECLQTLEGHSLFVNSVMFSPDGTKVASGSQTRR